MAINQVFNFDESKRVICTVIGGIIGAALGSMGIINEFMSFLMILTVAVPPIAGVLMPIN